MEALAIWLTPRQVGEMYGIGYKAALQLAKSGEVRGYWAGNRFRFNAQKTKEAYEAGVFERVLDTKRPR